MKKLIIALVFFTLFFLTTSSQAGVIADIHSGSYVPGSHIGEITNLVVTSQHGSPTPCNFYCTELPAGPNQAIYVSRNYTGCEPLVSAGDIITISSSTYMVAQHGDQHFDYLRTSDAAISITGSTTVPVFDVDLASLAGQYQQLESCLVHVVDGFQSNNTTDPNYGEDHLPWLASRMGTDELWSFVDIFWNYIPISEGDCYQGFTGIVRMPTLVFMLGSESFEIINCALPTDNFSWSGVKAMYR